MSAGHAAGMRLSPRLGATTMSSTKLGGVVFLQIAAGLWAVEVSAQPAVQGTRVAAEVPGCSRAQQRLDGMCIDQPVINFIKCLEKTSSGRLSLETFQKTSGD